MPNPEYSALPHTLAEMAGSITFLEECGQSGRMHNAAHANLGTSRDAGGNWPSGHPGEGNPQPQSLANHRPRGDP